MEDKKIDIGQLFKKSLEEISLYEADKDRINSQTGQSSLKSRLIQDIQSHNRKLLDTLESQIKNEIDDIYIAVTSEYSKTDLQDRLKGTTSREQAALENSIRNLLAGNKRGFSIELLKEAMDSYEYNQDQLYEMVENIKLTDKKKWKSYETESRLSPSDLSLIMSDLKDFIQNQALHYRIDVNDLFQVGVLGSQIFQHPTEIKKLIQLTSQLKAIDLSSSTIEIASGLGLARTNFNLEVADLQKQIAEPLAAMYSINTVKVEDVLKSVYQASLTPDLAMIKPSSVVTLASLSLEKGKSTEDLYHDLLTLQEKASPIQYELQSTAAYPSAEENDPTILDTLKKFVTYKSFVNEYAENESSTPYHEMIKSSLDSPVSQVREGKDFNKIIFNDILSEIKPFFVEITSEMMTFSKNIEKNSIIFTRMEQLLSHIFVSLMQLREIKWGRKYDNKDHNNFNNVAPKNHDFGTNFIETDKENDPLQQIRWLNESIKELYQPENTTATSQQQSKQSSKIALPDGASLYSIIKDAQQANPDVGNPPGGPGGRPKGLGLKGGIYAAAADIGMKLLESAVNQFSESLNETLTTTSDERLMLIAEDRDNDLNELSNNLRTNATVGFGLLFNDLRQGWNSVLNGASLLANGVPKKYGVFENEKYVNEMMKYYNYKGTDVTFSFWLRGQGIDPEEAVEEWSRASGYNQETLKLREEAKIKQFERGQLKAAEEEFLNKKAKDNYDKKYGEGKLVLPFLSTNQITERIQSDFKEINSDSKLQTLRALVSGMKTDSDEYIAMRKEESVKLQKAYEDNLKVIEKYITQAQAIMDKSSVDSTEYKNAKDFKEHYVKIRDDIEENVEPMILESVLREKQQTYNIEIGKLKQNLSDIDLDSERKKLQAQLNMDPYSESYLHTLKNVDLDEVKKKENELRGLKKIEADGDLSTDKANRIKELELFILQKKVSVKNSDETIQQNRVNKINRNLEKIDLISQAKELAAAYNMDTQSQQYLDIMKKISLNKIASTRVQLQKLREIKLNGELSEQQALQLQQIENTIAQEQLRIKELNLLAIGMGRQKITDRNSERENELLSLKLQLGNPDDSSPLLRNKRVANAKAEVHEINSEISKLKSKLVSAGAEETVKIQQEIRDLQKQSLQAQLGILDELKSSMGTFNLPEGVTAMSRYEYLTQNATHRSTSIGMGDVSVNITLPNITNSMSEKDMRSIGQALGYGIANGRMGSLRRQMAGNPLMHY